MQESPRDLKATARRRRRGTVLAIVFAAALLMGPGPGILLVNTPQPIFGLPAIYLWGLFWYAVEVGVVVLAYFFVWSDDEDSGTQP
jgi:hypothetical protein